MLDVVLEDQRRPVVVRARAAAACGSRGTGGRRRGCRVRRPSRTPARRRRASRCRAAPGRPRRAPAPDRSTDSPASRRAAATTAGDGRRLGAPTATRTAAPAMTPAATASRSSGTPAVPATASTTTSAEEREHRAPPPRPRQPRLADGRDRRGAGEVGQRREVGRRDPGAAGHRAGDAGADVERQRRGSANTAAPAAAASGPLPAAATVAGTPARPRRAPARHERDDLCGREQQLADLVGDAPTRRGRGRR